METLKTIALLLAVVGGVMALQRFGFSRADIGLFFLCALAIYVSRLEQRIAWLERQRRNGGWQ